MISWGPGAALTFHVLVSWCCVLLTAFTCETWCLHEAGCLKISTPPILNSVIHMAVS